MGTVLIVDDEAGIRDGLARAVGSKGHKAVLAANLGEAREALRAGECDCVLLDVRLPDGDGLDLLREIRGRPGAETPVIMATAYGDSPRAIAAMKAGAFEYITKPFDLAVLLDAVARAVKAKGLVRDREPASRELGADATGETLVGSSVAMLDVWKMIGRAAASDVPILISGETGTGKDLVARAIHENSARAPKPFVAVNLASLSSNLIESELMGHEKGAFTGAVALRRGRLEKAAGGTLFLDEIGDLDAAFQVKLLRFLQERTIRPVGAPREKTVDVRIVAATNKDLQKMVEGQKFREDLWYRLNVVKLTLPPLRERRNDVPLLARFFVNLYNQRYSHETKLTDSGVKTLQEQTWPGNVRQLQHLLERLVILAPRIDSEAVHDAIHASEAKEANSESLAETEAEQIRRVLAATGGNKSRAAQILGIERKTLYRKLERMTL